MSSQTPKGTAYESVKLAIETGYRHIDGALVYFNEHEVGQAIRDKIADGTMTRDEIFYCGKVCSVYTGPGVEFSELYICSVIARVMQ